MVIVLWKVASNSPLKGLGNFPHSFVGEIPSDSIDCPLKGTLPSHPVIVLRDHVIK